MLRNIGIRFDTKDYMRWLKAVMKVYIANHSQAKIMPRKCAVEYTNKVRENLKRFRSLIPLTSHYYKWKASMGLASRGFWRLHDNLLNNLKTFEVQPTKNEKVAYMGGIPNGIMVPRLSMYGGQTAYKEIAMYGKKAEELRPLFGPTSEMYIRSGYWESQLVQSKNKVKDSWV